MGVKLAIVLLVAVIGWAFRDSHIENWNEFWDIISVSDQLSNYEIIQGLVMMPAMYSFVVLAALSILLPKWNKGLKATMLFAGVPAILSAILVMLAAIAEGRDIDERAMIPLIMGIVVLAWK